jgi:hypothetical protein
MEIDTLVIDVDQLEVALVWRGQIPEDAFGASGGRLIVALLDGGRPEAEEVYCELARGHFSRAQVPAEADVPAPPAYDVELLSARQKTLDRTPAPRLALAEYVGLAWELSRRPGERPAILARHDLDDVDWMLEERGWQQRMALLRKRGDQATIAEMKRVIAAARKAAAHKRLGYRLGGGAK